MARCAAGNDVSNDRCDGEDDQDGCSFLETVGCECCGNESKGGEDIDGDGQVICLQRGVSVNDKSVHYS